jgi:hypothetical protein
MQTFLKLGDNMRERLLRVPLALVLGDAKSQDTITGRYGGHNCAQMCRACNVSFQEWDDPEHVCVWASANQFIKYVDIVLDENNVE